jgi:general stress protein 26
VSEDLNRRVKEALERTEIMALSTIGSDGPWTAPVQFRYNERLELFFLSMPDTRHVRNILSDPRVSVAIYHHPGPPGGNLGLQISGTAEHLTEESSPDGWQSFRIIPREIWCFDSRVFGTERRQVAISDLRL